MQTKDWKLTPSHVCATDGRTLETVPLKCLPQTKGKEKEAEKQEIKEKGGTFLDFDKDLAGVVDYHPFGIYSTSEPKWSITVSKESFGEIEYGFDATEFKWTDNATSFQRVVVIERRKKTKIFLLKNGLIIRWTRDD